MIVYYVIRAVEVLVTVFVGFRLITQSYDLRWDNVSVKISLGFGLGIWSILLIANSFLFKISGIEHLYTAIFFLVFIKIFYDMPLLYVFVYSILYWSNLLLVHLGIAYISSNLEKKSMDDYIVSMNSWNIIQLLSMCAVVILIFLLCRARKGKPLVTLSEKKDFIRLLCLLVFEWIIMNTLFSDDMIYLTRYWGNVLIWISFIILVIGIGIIYIIYRSYLSEKNQSHLLELRCQMVEDQYKYMQDSYDIKRSQIHDSSHQNRLLKGYLESGKIDEAFEYLEEIQNKTDEKGIKFEIGISAIDIILNSKMDDAEKYGIKVCTDFDVCFCPLKRNDLCVLLGNLLDNAIEAVRGFEKESKIIFVKMQTVNNIFLLEIRNEYKGNRKRSDGKYVTTKEDGSMHGLGLESCKRIVERYDGMFEIVDSGKEFKVEVTIFTDELE